ncbi:MAG: hypothetical protein KBT30_01850 [Clostridiales bacterium]|nr:hypothetical protein [Candidatus Apopatousia equi]
MQYTTNYNYSLPESDDVLETASRVGYNNNFSDIDTQIKDANDDIDSIGEEVDTISTQISAIDTQIGTINTQIGAIDTRVDTLEAHDYIVEQGTSGDFKYRKWNSGLLEVDFSSSYSVTTSSTSGSMFWAQLPQVAIPEVCRSITNWSHFQPSIEATGYFLFIILRENTLQNFKCQVMAEQNRTFTGTYNFSYKGTWK